MIEMINILASYEVLKWNIFSKLGSSIDGIRYVFYMVSYQLFPSKHPRLSRVRWALCMKTNSSLWKRKELNSFLLFISLKTLSNVWNNTPQLQIPNKWQVCGYDMKRDNRLGAIRCTVRALTLMCGGGTKKSTQWHDIMHNVIIIICSKINKNYTMLSRFRPISLYVKCIGCMMIWGVKYSFYMMLGAVMCVCTTMPRGL